MAGDNEEREENLACYDYNEPYPKLLKPAILVGRIPIVLAKGLVFRV